VLVLNDDNHLIRSESSATVSVLVCCWCWCGQMTAVSELPVPSTAHSPSLGAVGCSHKLATNIVTCTTSLSRNSKSAVASDAIRHMQLADMEHLCEIPKQQPHVRHHRFGDPRFALSIPGHLEAPIPRTWTETCRYPIGIRQVIV
jgi:L-asparaginase II